MGKSTPAKSTYTVDIDLSLSDSFKVQIPNADDRTGNDSDPAILEMMINLVNLVPQNTDTFIFMLELSFESATASEMGIVVWDPRIVWQNDTAPTMEPGFIAVYTFITTDNGDTYKGFVSGDGFLPPRGGK